MTPRECALRLSAIRALAARWVKVAVIHGGLLGAAILSLGCNSDEISACRCRGGAGLQDASVDAGQEGGARAFVEGGGGGIATEAADAQPADVTMDAPHPDAGAAGGAGGGGGAGTAGTIGSEGGDAGSGGGAGDARDGGADSEAGRQGCSQVGARECVDLHSARVCLAEGYWAEQACVDSCANGACVVPNSVTAGHQHTCAVLSDSTIRCWGGGSDGQLGTGDAPEVQLLPQPVLADVGSAALQGVASASAGAFHTCAAMADGSARCWGLGHYGQIGDGQLGAAPSGANRRALVATTVLANGTSAEPLGNVATVAAGGNTTCALLKDSSVRCWGYGHYGQLGTGVSGDGLRSATPLPVVRAVGDAALLSGVVEISVGNLHICALLDSGMVRCWGNGEAGQLGDGRVGRGVRSAIPVTVLESDGVTPLAGVAHLAAGYFHTCAAKVNQTVACWGDGYFGQLGRASQGAGVRSGLAVPVLQADTGATLSGIMQIGAGNGVSCGTSDVGALQCWGDNRYGLLANGEAGPDAGRAIATKALRWGRPNVWIDDAARVAAGLHHACVLSRSHVLRCFGSNASGQLTAKQDSRAARDVFWAVPDDY